MMTIPAQIGEGKYLFYRVSDLNRAVALYKEGCHKFSHPVEFEDAMESKDIDFTYDMGVSNGMV